MVTALLVAVLVVLGLLLFFDKIWWLRTAFDRVVG